MILQSLARLAEREGLVANPDFETKEIHWRITVTADGRFVGLESLLQAPDPGSGRSRGRARGPSVAVPRPFPGARRQGVESDAGFMVDNASFVLGLDVSAEQKYAARAGELERRMEGFRSLMRAAVEATQDRGLGAIDRFLATPDEVRRACREVTQRAEAGELAPNHLIGFRLDQDECAYAHRRGAVVQYWAGYRQSLTAQADVRQCLVTGTLAPVIDKHPLIKKLPGGTASGVAVVSFNEGAFESYGFRRNENAPVSRAAAEAYTAALNRLLDPSFPDPSDSNVRLAEQRVQLSPDTVAVFWTDAASRVPAALVPAIARGDPEAAKELGYALELDESYATIAGTDDAPPSPEPLRTAHEAPWKGIKPGELADPGPFRLLVLTGGQGRAIVRGFHTTRIRDTVQAVRDWFEDIKLDGLRRRRPALNRLLNSLAVRGDPKRLPPGLAGQVFLAIVARRPLPVAVLETAVRRCRSGSDTGRDGVVPPERAALVKAYLNRARRQLEATQGMRFQEVTPAMNEHERNRGYLLGRMFACIERMQELALGEVGASVTDRYFGAACATPQAVFPRLLKTEVHHYRKAREGQRGGTARWLHGEISQLATWLVGEANGMREGETLDAFLHRLLGRPVTGFPPFLPLPEQGLFTLGYHQQRAEFFKRREVSTETSGETVTTQQGGDLR